jgi:SAM-dependent methyltransferase
MLHRVRHWLLFNHWYLRQAKPPWDTGISPPELHAFIAAHAPGRALDLGCGTGTNVITLAQHGWDVVGIDFAVKAIAQARRKLRQADVRADVRVGDVTRVALDGTFDLILDIGCFHGLPATDQDRYAQRVVKSLAPCGTFLLYVQWKQTPGQRTGITESDLARFALLTLERREDGIDTARTRPSSWLTFVNDR